MEISMPALSFHSLLFSASDLEIEQLLNCLFKATLRRYRYQSQIIDRVQVSSKNRCQTLPKEMASYLGVSRSSRMLKGSLGLSELFSTFQKMYHIEIVQLSLIRLYKQINMS